MCDASCSFPTDRINRRSLLKFPLALAAAGALSGGWFAARGFADALTADQRDRLSPDEVLSAMKAGNERFRAGKESGRDFLAEQRASAAGQYPMAALLTCIDSRAPAEVVMDLGIGNVFNCRVAGNVANDDILGSMEFACKLSGSKVVLVMGHTNCGAIKGAIDKAELGNLTHLLRKIQPAVDAVQNFDGLRTSKNYAFVDAVARKNVELTLDDIRKNSPILRDMESAGTLKLAGAMYNLKTAMIDFF